MTEIFPYSAKCTTITLDLRGSEIFSNSGALKEKMVLAEVCAMRNDFSEALYHRMMADMAHRILKEKEMDD
jgi:hypothetical protein